MTAHLGEAGWSATLRTEHRRIDLAEVTGAYYRRPSRWDLPAGMSPEERAWAASEARFGFGGLLSAAVPWLNHPAAIARAEYKPLQLHTAVRSGLRVPATALTNDPREAALFAGRHDGEIVYKSLSGELVADDGTVRAIYTTPLADDGGDPAIAGTAHLFQRRIADKAYDVRVTAVDETLFAVAIHPDTQAGRLDWRRDYDRLRYEVVAVPDDVASKARDLMRRLTCGSAPSTSRSARPASGGSSRSTRTVSGAGSRTPPGCRSPTPSRTP